MRLDRKFLSVFMAILGFLAIGLLSLLLAERMVAVWGLIVIGIRLLGDLPQWFWWAAGIAALSVYGLGISGNLLSMMWPRAKESPSALVAPGRLGTIYRNLSRKGYGEYHRRELRDLLGSLAVDFIALKRDIPESDALRVFREGNWTDDPGLRSYLLPRESSREQNRGLWRRFRKRKPASFPEETQDALERLIAYSESEEAVLGISQADD